MDFKNLFLPIRFRCWGLALLVPGFFMFYIRFYSAQQPEFLDFKVFAFASTYLETKYFSIIQNNISEEITGILSYIGLFFIAFSKENKEKPEYFEIRINSFFVAFFINSILTVLSFLFLYGLNFIEFLIFNLFSVLIIFFIIVQIRIFKFNRQKH